MMAVQLPNGDPPLPDHTAQQLRGHARRELCSTLGRLSQRAAAGGDHPKAMQALRRLLAVPGIGADEIAAGESNLATSLVALGRLGEAEEAAMRAISAEAPTPTIAAFALNTAACCKEKRADVEEDPEQKAAHYASSKALFRAAHNTCRDPASSLGFRRVSAKSHPEIEWTELQAGGAHSLPGGHAGELLQGSGMGGGGLARPTREGVVLESLE